MMFYDCFDRVYKVLYEIGNQIVCLSYSQNHNMYDVSVENKIDMEEFLTDEDDWYMFEEEYMKDFINYLEIMRSFI